MNPIEKVDFIHKRVRLIDIFMQTSGDNRIPSIRLSLNTRLETWLLDEREESIKEADRSYYVSKWTLEKTWKVCKNWIKENEIADGKSELHKGKHWDYCTMSRVLLNLWNHDFLFWNEDTLFFAFSQKSLLQWIKHEEDEPCLNQGLLLEWNLTPKIFLKVVYPTDILNNNWVANFPKLYGIM